MKYTKYIILFAIGVLIGGGMCRTCTDHFRSSARSETDTIYVHDTVRYSRLELTKNSCRLDVPKVSMSKMVYIPYDSVTTIYRDNIQYVTLPRQCFHTKTQDAEVWHSGIDSTIDSLVVFRNDMVISKTETTTQTVTKRNALALGIEAMYFDSFQAPAYLQYSYRPNCWFAVYGKVAYDLPTRLWGVSAGMNVCIQW